MHKFRRLLQYTQGQRLQFVLIFVLTVATSIVAILQPWPMKILADQILGKVPPPAWLERIFQLFAFKPSPSALLLVVVFGGFVLFLLNSALDVVLTRLWTLSGRRMVYGLAEDLFARLQRQSLAYHSRYAVGDTMARVTSDSWSVYQVLDTLIFTPGHALLMLLLMVILMMHLDASLTLFALMIAPLMAGASFIMGKQLRLAAKLKRQIEIRIQAHVQQTLTGIPVVQAFVQEEREQERFERFAETAIRVQQRGSLLGSLSSLGSGLIATLATGAILWIGAQHVVEGRLTIGGILVFLYYLGSLQTQLTTLAGVHTSLQGLSAGMDRVMEVLNTSPDIASSPAAPDLPHLRGHVEIENVTFGYESNRPVLRDVSLKVNPGETVAIAGITGAGKTSLVNLLPRFYDPWRGRVLLDGHDIRDVRLQSLRSQIALVMQESFLFPCSISENIAFGKPNASRSEIETAAQAASADEFIGGLPQGYDTIIGERGITLSGGERQRLSIARALLKNAPILILDEPTSALDSETEQSILNALERLMRGRTTFIVAHRLSTVRRADRIVILENGVIAEMGTHAELLAHGRLYARLHQSQFESKRTAPATE